MPLEPTAAPAEAWALARKWADLSRAAAAESRGWLAVHAQTAADVEALRGLLLQRATGAAEGDPAAHYAESASALSDALGRAAVTPGAVCDGREAAQRVRGPLLDAFDPALRADAQSVLGPLDHLDGLDAFGPVEVVPDDPAAAVGLPAGAGPEAVRLAEGYLGYLTDAARSLGDSTQATVVLRLAAARAALGEDSDNADVRTVLLSTLPSAEQDRLQRRWAGDEPG